MKVLLITGESGVGKTTFAKRLKENYNYNIVHVTQQDQKETNKIMTTYSYQKIRLMK